MRKKSLSIRASLIIGIMTMGLIGIAMVFLTAKVYRDLGYQNQQNALTELLGLKVSSVLEDVNELAKTVGLNLQIDEDLRNAIREQDGKLLQEILINEFERFHVSTGILKLHQILIYDLDFKIVGRASNKGFNNKNKHEICNNVVDSIKYRKGVERLKPYSAFCNSVSTSAFSIVVPVATLNPFAYLMIVIDPASSVRQIEQALGIPIKITRANGEVAYQSESWPQPSRTNEFIIAKHTLRSPEGSTVLISEGARDIAPYRAQLAESSLIIILLTSVFFITALFIALYLLQKTLNPLEALKNAARSLSKGKYIKVAQTSMPEINIVIKSFNKMAEEITNLIDKLQKEIFDRKKAELELKKHQADLSLARDQAFAASRAKSVFLANMSHELRTPLNAIIGYSEILHDDAMSTTNSMQLDDLQKIQAAGKHLLNLINDILDLSKIEAGKMELNLEPFEIEPLLQDCVATATPIAIKNNNRITTTCDTQTKTMIADPTKLRQSLLNILSNACKFTENGDITIVAGNERRNGEDWIYFSITDTGIGISESQSQKLFSEFTQADSSATKSYGGTGLGLAISKRLTELMGGHITYSSKLGVGSRFTIYIPKEVRRKLALDLKNFEFHLQSKIA